MFPILPFALVGIGAKLVIDELNSKKIPVPGSLSDSPVGHSLDGDLKSPTKARTKKPKKVYKTSELLIEADPENDRVVAQMMGDEDEQLSGEDEQLSGEDEQLQAEKKPELIPPRKRGRPRKVQNNGN